MRAYSLDLRRRVVAAFEAGTPWPEVVRLFGVSRATLNRYRKRLRDGASLAPGHSPGRPRGVAPPDEPLLEARLRDAPDATLADHCRWWREERGETISVPAMRRAIRRLGWTRKKRRWQPPSATRTRASSGATTCRSSTPSGPSSSTSAGRISP
jgi:transposase